MELKDTVALITGGGSGLGEATAREFVSRRGQGRHPRSAELNRTGAGGFVRIPGPVRCGRCRLGDAVEKAIAQAVDRFGALHIAVNCAGIGKAQRTVSKDGPHSLELFTRVVQVNLIGTFNVIRLAANQMSRNNPNSDGERGVIINTASIAAFDGQIGQAAYSASKGGVVGLTLPVARDLASVGIRVCTIAPGTFDTPMLATLPETARRALGAQIPFPSRLGRPAEYAALARHIVENAMLNGETIRLDGALRMAPR